jgi:hypothetical protein
MKPAVLLSKTLIAEYVNRVQSIIDAAPRKIDVLAFDKLLELSPAEADAIEAAYYSRDVWEGTLRNNLTPAAHAFWSILDRARNLKWLAVYSAGTDAGQYQPLPADSPFCALPNVLISPHNARASRGTAARGVEIFLRNLDHYLHGPGAGERCGRQMNEQD